MILYVSSFSYTLVRLIFSLHDLFLVPDGNMHLFRAKMVFFLARLSLSLVSSGKFLHLQKAGLNSFILGNFRFSGSHNSFLLLEDSYGFNYIW